jgi:hypothetical protein
MIGRTRACVVPGLFVLIIFNLACSGFFQVYWLKDNQWRVEPNDLNIRWLSDADYQALETSTGSEYTTDGRTLVMASKPGDREKFLSLYQIGTPDGQWHGWVSTRLAAHSLHVWLGVAVPAFALSMVGLFLSRPRQKKDHSAAPGGFEELT